MRNFEIDEDGMLRFKIKEIDEPRTGGGSAPPPEPKQQ